MNYLLNTKLNIINNLYGGEVKLKFDTFRHKYSVEGKDVIGVTSVLGVIAKPALISWAANTAVDYVAEQIEPGKSYDELELDAVWQAAKKAHWTKKTDAGTIGSFVHKFVEQYIKGENPAVPVNEGLQNSANQFLSWVKEHDVKFLASEQPIYSKQYNYAGTLDFICKIDHKLYIGDLKTSSGIYDEYWLQTAAYRQAREEEFVNEKYAGQLIVRIGKDGEFEFGISNDEEKNKRLLEGFISALTLQQTLERLKEESGRGSKNY